MTWLVEKLVPGGDGMVRLPDGRVGFVTGGLPGDVLVPTTLLTKKGYVRAEAWSIEQPSPLRVTPPCPVADRCGGCDWMSLGRDAQLEQKGAILAEALRRTGGFTGLPSPLPVVTAGRDLGYRARVQFHIDSKGAIGFFAKRSHALVEVDGCPVCRPELDRALALLRELDRTALRCFSGVEVRSALEGARVALRFEVRRGVVVSRATRAALAGLPDDLAVIIEDEVGGGRDEQVLSLPGGVRVGAGPGAFTQVNPDVNELLVSEMVAGAKARGVSRFCDLFAGVGNFALPLLAAGMSGVAVEHDGRAMESARRAAKKAGLPDDAFIAEDAALFVARVRQSESPFDLVIMDPPRRGAKEVLEHVVRLAPRHIAMCSCDPVTLARDLATLAAAGYELGDVRAFDMFPHTHHLEALAWMERKTGRTTA